MMICIDVPDEAAGELKVALQLAGYQARVQATTFSRLPTPEDQQTARHWEAVSREFYRAMESIHVRARSEDVSSW